MVTLREEDAATDERTGPCAQSAPPTDGQHPVDGPPPTDGFVVTPSTVGAMSSEQLEHQMCVLSGHLASATASFLVMVGEYDERGDWNDWEAVSCAHWLSWRCGVGMVAAREQVRVARALRGLPVVTARFLAGELSYSKVRAITRVAHANNEADLAEMAQWGTATHVERACSALRRCQRQEDEEQLLRDGEDLARDLRSFTWHRDDLTGDLIGRVRVPAEDAEILVAALESSVTATRRATKHAADAEESTLAQQRLDALVDLARHFVSSPRDGASCDSQAAIVVRVDATALAQESASPADVAPDDAASGSASETSAETAATDAVTKETAETAAMEGARAAMEGASDGLRAWPVMSGHGQRLSIAVLQRLSCDAGMRLVVRLGDGTELDAAPHRRTPSRALRRWLLRRDGGCRFPGCEQRHSLHAHHIIHWEHDGPTVRENLLMLCPKHHRAVHEGGWGLTGPASDPTFTRPDHLVVPEAAPKMHGALAELAEAHRRHGRDISVDGAGGTWLGDRIDWDCFFAAFADGPRAVRPDRVPPPG